MTIDKTREWNKKGTHYETLAAFTPVPRHYNRHDGWTAERQRGFIEALADTGSVKAAAHAVNMAPEGAYQLRRHPEAHEFRKAWEAALKLGVQRLEDIAMERALHGTESPVYCHGEIIGSRTVYNDRLLMFLLRNRAKKRFKADSWQKEDAYTQGQLKKLKQQWRGEWQAELDALDQRSIEEVTASIERQVEAARQRVMARERAEYQAASPRTRELYAAYRQSRREDEAMRTPGLLTAPDDDRETDCFEIIYEPSEA